MKPAQEVKELQRKLKKIEAGGPHTRAPKVPNYELALNVPELSACSDCAFP